MKKRDFCKDQLAENKLQQEKQERKKEDVDILLETLEEKIKKASAEKDEILGEIDTLNTELAKAAQEREEQNKAFQSGVDDQRETQKLLKGALKVLSDYYSKASLLELSDTSEDLACLLAYLLAIDSRAANPKNPARRAKREMSPTHWTCLLRKALVPTRRTQDPKVSWRCCSTSASKLRQAS